MDIIITGGVGTGSTELSSFDDALFNAGVSNYNLIYLSSIIPPNSNIKQVENYITPEEDFGKRLYVVKAFETTSKIEEHIAAGIGWYKIEEGKGFFVEHHAKGGSDVYLKVSRLIDQTLQDMCERRKIKFDSSFVDKNIHATVCIDLPISVISLAVYQYQS